VSSRFRPTRGPGTVPAVRILAAAILLATACGSSGGGAPDGGGGDDALPDGGVTACARPAAADGARRVVVSHPYTEAGGAAAVYRVLTLSADGELSETDTTFELGRARGGAIAFTPDGKLAFVAQDDGTIGVVAFDDDEAAPRVVHAGVDGVYAGAVTVAPDGDRLYVLDQQWREHGGGIYQRAIGCDGSLGAAELVLAAKLPEAMFALPGADRLLVVARDVLDTTGDRDAHLVAMDGAPTVIGSVDAFPDDEALVSSAALSHDGRYLLIADNSELSGIPNRIAAVEIRDDGLAARQVLTPIEDPYRVLSSPFGDAALVVSGYGDALFALDYRPGDEEPYAVRGELSYVGPRPMLPGDAVMIERGALRGLVLVAEVGGVRRVRFGAAGAVTDLGVLEIGGGGVAGLIGALGVAP
jgi:hypothetical protein